MLLEYDLFHGLDPLGILCGQVVVFVNVVGQVVEVTLALLNEEFPVALTHGYLVGLAKLPVEEIVLLLLLMAGDEEKESNSALLTLALYLFL